MVLYIAYGQNASSIFFYFYSIFVCSMYEMRTPCVVFHDLDDLKQLMIKEFQNFADRRVSKIRSFKMNSFFNSDKFHVSRSICSGGIR